MAWRFSLFFSCMVERIRNCFRLSKENMTCTIGSSTSIGINPRGRFSGQADKSSALIGPTPAGHNALPCCLRAVSVRPKENALPRVTGHAKDPGCTTGIPPSTPSQEPGGRPGEIWLSDHQNGRWLSEGRWRGDVWCMTGQAQHGYMRRGNIHKQRQRKFAE